MGQRHLRLAGEEAMRVFEQARIVLGLALLSGAGGAFADVSKEDTPAASTPETILIVGDAEKCEAGAPDRARRLAESASKAAAYQRAGECYLAAGEHALADQAFVKAAAQASPDTSRRLAANLDEVKAQARQVKAAFRRR
jgi:hypothetical protein